MRNGQTKIQNILSIEVCQMKGHLSAQVWLMLLLGSLILPTHSPMRHSGNICVNKTCPTPIPYTSPQTQLNQLTDMVMFVSTLGPLLGYRPMSW